MKWAIVVGKYKKICKEHQNGFSPDLDFSGTQKDFSSAGVKL